MEHPPPFYSKALSTPPTTTSTTTSLSSSIPTTSISKLPRAHLNEKLLISATNPFAPTFSYSPHLLSSFGITQAEWSIFISALSSSIFLTAGQKAKAITAGIATGILVNPWLGIVVGMGIWRREIWKIVIRGMEGYEAVEEGSEGNRGLACIGGARVRGGGCSGGPAGGRSGAGWLPEERVWGERAKELCAMCENEGMRWIERVRSAKEVRRKWRRALRARWLWTTQKVW
ncbi:MAG: hypothetical protein Q9200_002241 [Gallowayella weberi]